jgi:hypothetical protein
LLLNHPHDNNIGTVIAAITAVSTTTVLPPSCSSTYARQATRGACDSNPPPPQTSPQRSCGVDVRGLFLSVTFGSAILVLQRAARKTPRSSKCTCIQQRVKKTSKADALVDWQATDWTPASKLSHHHVTSRFITSRLSTCQAESGEEDDHTDHSGLMPIVQDSLPTAHMGISHYIVCSRRREVVFTPHSPAFS